MIGALLLACTSTASAVDAPTPAAAVVEDGAVRQVVMSALDASDDVPPSVRAVLEEALVQEVRKLSGLVVFGTAELSAMLDLEAQRQVAGCSDESCLAEIGQALGSEELVTSSLQLVGDSWVLTARRLDVARAKPLASATARVPSGDGEAVLAAVGTLIETLYPNTPLREGRTRGVPPELAGRLFPPPLPAWATWSAAGVAGASWAATGVLAVVWLFNQSEFHRLQEPAVVDGARLKEAQGATVASYAAVWALAGTSVLATAVAAAMVPFTDWE